MKQKPLHPFRLCTLLLLLATASCGGGDDLLPQPPGDDGSPLPVGFSASVVAPADTRASGELTTANITSMGVFAYYTGQSNWSTTNIPNFMWDEYVGRTNSSSPWTYDPVKYWPNTAGDKITFFAYAPHTDDVRGLSVNTTATDTGYPELYYEFDSSDPIDLLAAAALKDRTKSASSQAFAMKHVMTRVLVNVKCPDAIKVTYIGLTDLPANYGTLTWNDSGNPVWKDLGGSLSASCNTPTDVSADVTKQVAEFFLPPATPTAGSLDITFSLNGSTETKNVDIPSSPAWTPGQAVAYTLNIEVGSEITLSVKAWDTNDANKGTVGEDVPTSGYPYLKNGIVYMSASHAFALGAPAGNVGGWAAADSYCRNTYEVGPYKKGEWRLPMGEEWAAMYQISELGYQSGGQWWWAYNCVRSGQNPSHGYATGFNTNGYTVEQAVPTATNTYLNTRCVRDVVGLQQPQIIDRTCYHSGGAFVVAKNNDAGGHPASERCISYTEDGVSGWRLPTRDELEIISLYLGALNIGKGAWYASSSWWVAYGYVDHPSDYFPEIKSFSEAGFLNYATSRCVRDK